VSGFADAEGEPGAAERLAGLGRLLAESLDPETVSRRIVDGIRELLAAEAATLYRLDPVSEDLVSVAVSGDVGSPPGGRVVIPRGTAVSGLAVETGEPVVTADVLADPRITLTTEERERAERARYGAVIAVPLTNGGRAVGALVVGARRGRVFRDEEIRLLRAFADEAALALENARLHGEALRGRREAELVADLARAVNASLDLDTVLQRLTEGAKDLGRADMAHVLLSDPSTGRMELWYCSDSVPHDIRVEPGKGAGGLVVETRRPFRTEDYAADPRITKDYLAETAAEGIVALIAVPILTEDHVAGVLYLENRRPRPFTDEDEALLVRLAEHAATAIRNARLYAESEMRRAAAEHLAAVGRLVSRSLDLSDAAQRIANSIRELLGALAATLYRLDASSGDLVALASSDPEGLWQRPGEVLVLPSGIGLSALAVRERRGVVTADSPADPRISLSPEVRARLEQGPFRAALAVPLLAHGRVIGALAVGDRSGRVFGEEDLRLAQAFADQAAVALENARLFSESSGRLRETETLLGVAQSLSAEVRVQEAMRQVCRRIARAVDADMVGAYAVDGSGKELTPLAGYHVPEDLLDVLRRTPFPVARFRLLQEGMAAGKPVWTDDYPNDPRVDETFLAAHRPRSLVFAPTQSQGESVGGLFLAWWTRSRVLSPADLRLVEAVAALVGQAIQRARAEAEVATRLRQQAAIAELGQRALGETDLQALLDEAVRVVARTLGVEFAKVLELLPGGEALRLRAGIGWTEGLVGQATVGAGRDSQAGYTLLSGAPVIVEDLRTEQRFSGPPLLHDHGVVSGLSVLIGSRDSAFGVLGAHTSRRRTFAAEEVRFLQTAAHLLAAATERARAMEALWQSEARFRSTFDDSRVGRCLQTLDGRYLRVNRAFQTLVGYTEGELLAMTWQELTHPEDLAADRELDRRMMAGEINPYSVEKRYIDKRGRVVWASVNVSLLRDGEGEPRYLLAEAEDITLRRKALEALHQYVERLRILREIDQHIIAARSPAAIAGAALRRLRRVVPCDRACVTLFSFEAAEALLLAVDCDGESCLPGGARVSLSDWGDLETLLTGEARLVDDIASVSPKPWTVQVLEDEGIRSWLGVPLTAQGALIGALYLSARAPRAFATEQAKIAREVADSLAVAIEDARLRERLQALSRQLVNIQEVERRDVARELHDEIGQILTGLKLTLETTALAPAAVARARLDEATTLVRDLMTKVRELSLDLRPAMLDDLGLLPALLGHIERYTAQTGVRVTFAHAGLDRRLVPEVETAAYRIVQEALTNVARHAGVSEAALRVVADETRLAVAIVDGGRGFQPGASGSSGGLASMRERAMLLGGCLTVESTPGAGTRVTAELPLGEPRGQHATSDGIEP
jgi:PAS domain S-box-containing protein